MSQLYARIRLMKEKIKERVTKTKGILDTIVQCIVPVIPLLIGAGMLKVVLMLIGPTVFGLLSESSNTYIVLEFVSDAGYYFLPIYIAVSSAGVFKIDKFIAALSGAILVSPVFIEYVTSGQTLSVFGLPITMTDYSNQIIPSIIITWILSIVYKFLDKHINKNLKPIFLPLLCVIAIIPISLCLVGPLGHALSNALVNVIMKLANIGPLGNAIMCAMIPYITICGLGGANISAMLSLAATGCDPILFFSNVLYNTILGFVAFAIYVKNKKPETLAAAVTAAVAGASEPSLFGVVIKKPISLFCLTVADFFAGLYAGITGVKSFSMSSFGAFGIISTIGPGSSIIHAIIALLIGCTIGFVLTFVLTKKK